MHVNRGCHAFLERRGVSHLIHITYQKLFVEGQEIEPAKKILTEGLVPNRPGLDALRLDGFGGALCFSVSLPNLAFFYKRTLDLKEAQRDLSDAVAIIVPISLVERPDAYFARTNAASVKYADTKQGLRALEGLFDNAVDTIDGTLRRMGCDGQPMPDELTTSQQAEVLFTEPISVSCISGMYFPSSAARQRFREAMHGPLPRPDILKVDWRAFPFHEQLCPDKEIRFKCWNYKDKGDGSDKRRVVLD